MTVRAFVHAARGAPHHEPRAATPPARMALLRPPDLRRAADLLPLAATPTFAVMALVSGLGASPMDRLCASGSWAPLSGMALMYAIMSAFHAPPWLKLISGRSGNARSLRQSATCDSR